MPSKDSTRAAFLAIAIVVVLSGVMFVLPGYLTGTPAALCSPVSQPWTLVGGHRYCYERASVDRPPGCSPGWQTTNGSKMVATFSTITYSARLSSNCVQADQLGLNGSISELGEGPYPVHMYLGTFFLDTTVNWTTPDYSAGIQWTGAGHLNLLVGG